MTEKKEKSELLREHLENVKESIAEFEIALSEGDGEYIADVIEDIIGYSTNLRVLWEADE